MEWQRITPNITGTVDGRFRVRCPDNDSERRWVIERRNGEQWEQLPIPSCSTMEEAIERANIAIPLLTE